MIVEQSENISELAQALVKAQAGLTAAKKDSENPFFSSRYADLGAVWEACRPALTANGIAVVQSPDRQNGEVGVTTQLVHVSGQWIRGRIAAKPAKDDPQSVGSCITYLKRYSLAAMVGVVAEDDDDGERAQGRGRTEKGSPPPPRSPRSRVSSPPSSASSPPPPSTSSPSTHTTKVTIRNREMLTAGIVAPTLLALWDALQEIDRLEGKDSGKRWLAGEGWESSLDLTDELGRAVVRKALTEIARLKNAQGVA